VKQKIASIVKSFTNSAMALPVAWAKLTCGHTADCKVVPTVYACAACKRESTTASNCPCGTRGVGFNIKYDPNPHREADRLTFVGDEVECERCDWYAAALAKLRAMQPGELHHSRFRPYDSRGGSEGNYYIYKRDKSSPTGVTLYMQIEATKEAEEVLAALRAAPLSPTEPR
jgi:hypothetical protein